MKKHIRPIAICIFRQDNMLFVGQGYDSVKKEVFYRPFGGAIEFKEHSREAVKREILEELGQEISDLTYLAMMENIFVNEGKDGHEIVIIYEGRFQNNEMYEKEPFDVFDDGNFCWKALWKNIEDFTVKGDKLYLCSHNRIMDFSWAKQKYRKERAIYFDSYIFPSYVSIFSFFDAYIYFYMALYTVLRNGSNQFS